MNEKEKEFSIKGVRYKSTERISGDYRCSGCAFSVKFECIDNHKIPMCVDYSDSAREIIFVEKHQ